MPSPISKIPTGNGNQEKNEKLFDFSEAVKQLVKGKKVTKLEWNNPNIYLVLKEKLKIMKEDGKMYDLIISDGDALGEDWKIIN
jgi:hypothetical protein